MFDPHNYWRRAMAANLSLAGSAMRWGEAAAASATVIGIRSGIIATSMRSPHLADTRELSSMLPEKIAAFGKSQSAVAAELQSTRSGFASDWQKAGLGVASTLAAWTRMATLGLETLELTARLAEATIKPVHQAVTANARRLS